MKPAPLLALFSLLGLVAACSTPAKRIEENQSLYDAYSPDDKAAIKSGQIRQGFDQNQVYMALGKPHKKKASGADEEWMWLKTVERTITVQKDVNKYALERNEYEQGRLATAPSTEEQVTQKRTYIVKTVKFKDGRVESWDDTSQPVGEWQ
jgi:outer membrane protein assembly factor BamE (lipoprotein component of BamABCDE complex)